MKAFIKTILGFDPKEPDLTGGILGLVKGYYGCVEAQGRGTLHCHMLIWLEGGLNPNEIRDKITAEGGDIFRDRLLNFLDDSISNSIPVDPDPDLSVPSSRYHACTVRGLNGTNNGPSEQAKDVRNIVLACQQHAHTGTCFKYCRDNEQKECRFGLDVDNYEPVSSFDYETGELTLRCLDGLVNNFNETIIKSVRCNMDIKFIGSGPSAKAILYYITDYISKTQLKTHVAYAALELAIQKLGEYDPIEDLVTVWAKRMLQKCAHTMISHQELSAQQVCMYLNDFEDHFTSHTYRKLYWTSFESYIENQTPSPECYTKEANNQVDAINKTDDKENSDDESVYLNTDSEESTDNDDDDNSSTSSEDSNATEHITEVPLLSDEVILGLDHDGVMVSKSSYVMDYVHRGQLFDGISLWQFNAQIDKMKKAKKKVPTSAMNEIDLRDFNDTGFAHHSAPNDATSNPEPSDEGCTTEDNGISDPSVLLSTKHIHPKSDFLETHDDFLSHYQMVRLPNNKFINVPTGPSIPRRDKDYSTSRHAQLMLIFFKPWRSACDLKQAGHSWVQSFNHFLSSEMCDAHIRDIIGNMQILHECKDSRDDHYNNRQNRRRNIISGDVIGHGIIATDDEAMDANDNATLLDHLEAIESCHDINSAQTNGNVQECLLHAQNHHLFSATDSIIPDGNVDPVGGWAELIVKEDNHSEVMWQSAYDFRRDRWKKKISVKPMPSMPVVPTEENTNIQDGSALRTALDIGDPDSEAFACIAQDHPAEDDEHDVDIEAVIKIWGLNVEQQRAFRLVACKSFAPTGDPLRLYIAGAAGTGKSQVINALRDFFQQRSQERRFRVCCFMGVAAKNVGGMTLHAALSMSGRQHNCSSAKSNNELVAMWEGVDFLFIDEISMISCQFLASISQALSRAKGNAAAFGGINVIFAGDFAQLPPVADKILYSKIDTKANATKESGQNTVFGKLLWLSIKKVVNLQVQYRQAGEENSTFVKLLQRLRIGRCTEHDFQILTSRVLGNCSVDLSDNKWRNAPTIVTDNACKDELNNRCAIRFAKEHNQSLHWYFPVDKHNGHEISDPGVMHHLRSLTSNKTHQRLGRLPLCLGMPVLVSQNFDVEGGIVNGSLGIVKSIRYFVNAKGDRHLMSCVVTIPTSSTECMPNLPIHDLPILQDTISLQFKHPFTRRSCSIRRSQVPLVPAFAMTALVLRDRRSQKFSLTYNRAMGQKLRM
jgi:hypothetical protein